MRAASILQWSRHVPRGLARSLALRWALVVTLVAGLGLALMVHAVDRALRGKIEAEADRLTEIATQKTAERLEIEARLADQRLRAMVMRAEQELGALARQSRMSSLLRRRDEGSIAATLAPEFRRQGFDGGLLVDSGFVVLGGAWPGFPLAASEAALRQLEFVEAWQSILAANDRKTPSHYRYVGPMSLNLAMLFQMPIQDRYGILVATPVFDEFGEGAGLLIAYRLIQRAEMALQEFSQAIRAGILLLRDGEVLSEAGDIPAGLALAEQAALPGLRLLPASGRVAFCVPSLPLTRICVLRAVEEVSRFRDELQGMSAAETDRMQRRLATFAAGLAVLIGWLIILLTRRLTGPLTDIAAEVGRIANGDWTAAVRHVDRADEVGRIARAIEAMQYALIEHDRMRQEMVRIDALNQRRLAMGEAVGRFESNMKTVMGKISEASNALDGAMQAIGQAARSAERQADRIQESTLATATETSLVTGATIQLSRGLAEIDHRLRSARAIVGAGEAEAAEAGSRLDDVARLAQEVETAMETVQVFVADLAGKALGASREAADAGAAGAGFLPASGALSRLAEQTGLATGRIAEALTQLTLAAEGAASRLGDMNQRFLEAAREADGIAVVMAEQDAARRSISEGLASASDAMSGLNDAVEELRQSLTGAERATGDVAETARRIIADAHAIDRSLRLFVREVAA